MNVSTFLEALCVVAADWCARPARLLAFALGYLIGLLQHAPGALPLCKYLMWLMLSFNTMHVRSATVDVGDANWCEEAQRIFWERGFVILTGACDIGQCVQMNEYMQYIDAELTRLDPEGAGNRGHGRYSLGYLTNCCSHKAYVKLLTNSFAIQFLDRLYAGFWKPWQVWGGGGDLVRGFTRFWQDFHSDFPSTAPLDPEARRNDHTDRCLHDPAMPPAACVTMICHGISALNGPLGILTWKDMTDVGGRYPPFLDEMFRCRPHLLASRLWPLEAGSLVIRDVRVWHCGTPNLTSSTRSNPGFICGPYWVCNRWPPTPGMRTSVFDALDADVQSHLLWQKEDAVAEGAHEMQEGYDVSFRYRFERAAFPFPGYS